MRHRTAARSLLSCALLGLFAVGIARADDGDPPGVAARLSYVDGAVSMQPAGVEQWADAVLNRPFTSGDRLWTDQSSRAELQLGPLAIRLGQTTGFSFLNLDDSTAQMQVTAGTLELHVPQLEANQTVEIDTPALAVAVLQPGDYRVDVTDSGDSATVRVIAGEAEVNGAGQTIPLQAQQQATFSESGGLTAGIATLGPPDDFDSWCFERNRREAAAQQAIGSYVSPDVTGYEDLDQYGTWQSVPEYGEVWFPAAVPVGWAPYRIGHWVWIDPWGWTWVDAQPWGFAPFHYGRWAFFRGSWCWVPGPRRVRPVYAPALVAWVGAGAAVTLSLTAGPSVAWFPLAPRDVYVPPYRVSNTYVRNVNITNTTIINNTYITNVVVNGGRNYRSVNESIPGAVTAVPRSIFTSAQPVAPHAIRVPPTALRNQRVSPTPPPIAPVRASVLGSGAATGRRAHVPPQRLIDRPVVAMKIPPPAPVPFEKTREAIIANGGRPLPPSQLARLRPSEAPRPFRSARQPPAGGTARFRAPAPAARPSPAGQEFSSPPPEAPGREFRPPPPAARPPAERAPFEQRSPPAERPPVERPSIERPPVERPPVERPRIERPPTPIPPRTSPPPGGPPRGPPPSHGPPPRPGAAPQGPPARHAAPERREQERPQ